MTFEVDIVAALQALGAVAFFGFLLAGLLSVDDGPKNYRKRK